MDDRTSARTRREKGSSTTRVLSLLDLFTPSAPVWTVDMIQQELGLARATAYRYARELSDAGFLVPASGGGYVLGPRFIVFDRQIRMADPLLKVGIPVMEGMRSAVGGSQLLATYYGDHVLTAYEDRTDDSLYTTMERGRPFSLFRGAPSKAILAHLPLQQLKNVFLSHSETIASEGLGENWAEFRDQMKLLKRQPYVIGRGEIDSALIGLAAPIFRVPGVLAGSLCFIRGKASCPPDVEGRLGLLVAETAARISGGIQALGNSSLGEPLAYPTARLARP